MRLWLSRGSPISVREQLVTQVVLSVLSGDLKPGQRLPSTRELARRFHVHPNTVSAGYRQLARNDWVEFRKGSGVYVRERPPEDAEPAVALDKLISDFFLAARRLDAPFSQVRSRLKQWMDTQPPDHFLLLESDPELASIVTSELQKSLTLPIRTCALSAECSDPIFDGAIPVALAMQSKAARHRVPDRSQVLILHLRSPAESLAPYLPVPSTALIAIVSRWPPFLKNARTMLLAAGFHPDSLIFRDASKANWQRGLVEASAVICDRFTAQNLDGAYRTMIFSLISESSVNELMAYERFVRGS